MSIAIVEDEPKLAAILSDYLTNSGYQTVIYEDGTEALEALLREPPEIVLLDLMLPGTDGMEICKALRKHSNVPIIMLTAKVEEIDRLLGLEVGADDYICKPYSPREVVARVKAVLRRTGGDAPVVSVVPAQGLILDESAANVSVNENRCALTAVELMLLKTMLKQPGRIFNRSQLIASIYSDNRVVSDRTVDSHIKKLRQKLQNIDSGTEYIHSVYGIGYKYEVAKLD